MGLHTSNQTSFKKGQTPWNKGLPMSEESRQKLSQGHKAKGIKPNVKFYGRGIKNPIWKGDEAGYSALHKWLKYNFGKAVKCENPECSYPRKSKRGKLMVKAFTFHWANKSGEYKRDISDWWQLCISCHMQDGISMAHRFKRNIN
jgi:hypothetical protein